MSRTVYCDHCNRPMEVDSKTVKLADEHADGSIVCGACEGMQELPADVRECDRAECSKPAPFVIETTGIDIRRCRGCLLTDLTERGWFEFYDRNSCVK